MKLSSFGRDVQCIERIGYQLLVSGAIRPILAFRGDGPLATSVRAPAVDTIPLVQSLFFRSVSRHEQSSLYIGLPRETVPLTRKHPAHAPLRSTVTSVFREVRRYTR
jgi:hypothetical protein